jgi:hypothetical protein
VSWYTSNYRRRKAVTVRNTGGTATVDADTTIPKDLDEFWDVIDAAGAELRVTAADGFTLLTYDVDNGAGGAFDLPNRNGRIRIDAATAYSTADEVLLFWLYYDTVSAAGDGSSVVAMASIQTGYIDRGSPNWIGALVSPQRVGTDRPRHLNAKDATDLTHVWLDMSSFLERRGGKYAKRYDYEEPRRMTYTFVDQDGNPAVTLVSVDGVRWCEVTLKGGRHRRLFLRVPITGGTADTNYTMRVSVYTEIPPQSSHRILRFPVGFRVKNQLEPAT